MNEFDFIDKYLRREEDLGDTLKMGVGDDAAILKIDQNRFWQISTDMSIENRHFFDYDLPQHIAYKSLAVNLSDIASMGSIPRWILLSLALPDLNENWLNPFFKSLYELLDKYQVKLIGGDTTKGLRTISITIIGESDSPGLQRSQAQLGDEIWVTGKIGLAGASLYHHWGKNNLNSNEFNECEKARIHPAIRIEFMYQARHLLHAAQDISDGLLQDLNHILKSSKVGAKINVDQIPSLSSLKNYQFYYEWILNGGDDYEMILTVPEKNVSKLISLAKTLNVEIQPIGKVIEEQKCLLFYQNKPFIHSMKGFDHFEN